MLFWLRVLSISTVISLFFWSYQEREEKVQEEERKKQEKEREKAEQAKAQVRNPLCYRSVNYLTVFVRHGSFMVGLSVCIYIYWYINIIDI